MPETRGMPTLNTDWWTNPIALEALMQREGDEYGIKGLASAPQADGDEPEPFTATEEATRAGTRRSKRSTATVAAALSDALGEDYDMSDLDLSDLNEVADTIRNDSTDPEAALAALEDSLRYGEPEVDRAPMGESSGAYKVREGNWREKHGMPRKRKTVPPSQTPEAKRRRRIQKKADLLGIGFDDAERMTRKRSDFGVKRLLR